MKSVQIIIMFFVLVLLVSCNRFAEIELLRASDFFNEDKLEIDINKEKGVYDGSATWLETKLSMEELLDVLKDAASTNDSYTFTEYDDEHILIIKETDSTKYYYILTSRLATETKENSFYLHNMGIYLVDSNNSDNNVSIIFPYQMYSNSDEIHMLHSITTPYSGYSTYGKEDFLRFYKDLGRYDIKESENGFDLTFLYFQNDGKQAKEIVSFEFLNDGAVKINVK